MCSPVCSSTVIGCTYDIPSGIYNMYVYDIEEEGRLSDDWAISSTNITITGLEPTYPSLLQVTCSESFSISIVLVITVQSSCLGKCKQYIIDFSLPTYPFLYNKLM